MADMTMLRDEVTDQNISVDDLPEQGGGSFLVILPQTLNLRLPATLMQAWEPFDDPIFQDAERKIPVVNPATGQPAVIQRIRWKFDRDNPLTIVGGENDGQPFPQLTITNIPRKRSKKPEVPMVADAMYLLRESLGDPAPVTGPKAWVEVMGRHAGEVITVQTGLSARCNPEKIRYVGVEQKDAAGRVVGYESVEDPSGTKGCGKRFYTPDFKLPGNQTDPATGSKYVDRRFCAKRTNDRDVEHPGCGAYLRGFVTIERWLPRK